MSMAQIVAIALVATVLCIMIKEQRPEISLLIAVVTGVLIFMSICDRLSILLSLLEETAQKAGVGEGYFAIELAGKVMIMVISAPVLLSLLDVVMGLV